MPFGNCTEPSNVKAGGQACPIGFQCAGCGFYRPDPSYLPAIEDHIRSLKADRETAQAIDADEFIIRNLTDQITVFTDVADRMCQHPHQLQRAEIEEASKVLCRSRAVQGRTVLPQSITSLAARIDELARANQQLISELSRLRADNEDLSRRLTETQDDSPRGTHESAPQNP